MFDKCCCRFDLYFYTYKNSLGRHHVRWRLLISNGITDCESLQMIGRTEPTLKGYGLSLSNMTWEMQRAIRQKRAWKRQAAWHTVMPFVPVFHLNDLAFHTAIFRLTSMWKMGRMVHCWGLYIFLHVHQQVMLKPQAQPCKVQGMPIIFCIYQSLESRVSLFLLQDINIGQE